VVVKLGSNISSLTAQRELAKSSNTLARSFERLASGQRINRASDDSAGLAISSTLKSSSRVFSQAIRNVNDGVSVLNIAEGSLTELSNISIRQLELAEQAANGTYSLQQRRALNQEANALVDEFNRIVGSTEFNRTKLIDKSLSELRIQAGFGANGSIGFAISEKLARTTGDGTFSLNNVSAWAAAGNNQVALTNLGTNDTKLDALTLSGSGVITSYTGNGDGTFSAGTVVNTGALVSSFTLADMNGDHLNDIVAAIGAGVKVFMATGLNTFGSGITVTATGGGALQTADFNGDGFLDVVTSNIGSPVYFNNGDGTFTAKVSAFGGVAQDAMVTGDFNNDGRADIFAVSGTTFRVLSASTGGVFSTTATGSVTTGMFLGKVGDFNGDGNLDIIATNSTVGSVLLGNGDGTFTEVALNVGTGFNQFEVADIDGDGITDIVGAQYSVDVGIKSLIGNGDGTFKAAMTSSTPTNQSSFSIGDLDGDGALDVISSNYTTNAGAVYFGRSRKITTIGKLNINTRAGALLAINEINGTINRISQELGVLGATQSRYSVALNTLGASRENFEAAGSRITDVDTAEESSVVTRTQILQKASSAVLAQANQQPALALKLLT